MPRAVPLTPTATWWPSTLYQTTTLELRRGADRLLVDPGISPWEIDEVVSSTADPVTQVLVTHADWDHVMALGVLADALHCEQEVEPPADVTLGPWSAVCRPGRGHTDDGLLTLFPEERILVIGDYLSELEIPFAHSSVADYQQTIHTLIGVIERERPEFVVVGHGRPHTSDRALQIADEDLGYVEALLAFAQAGCPADQAERIAVPFRGGGPYDRVAHGANVKLVCEAAGATIPA